MKAILTRKGTALMIVVIFSVVITAFSFTLLDTSLLDFRKINQREEETLLKALADGALEMMVLQLLENPPRLEAVSTPKTNEGQGFSTAETLSSNQFRIRAWADSAHPSESHTQKHWEWTLQIQNGHPRVLSRKLLLSHRSTSDQDPKKK